MVGYWNINKSNSSSTTKAAFVTPTDHSMLHKTQRPPLFTFPSSAALRHPPPPPTLPYLRPLQLETEHPMEAIQASALKEHHRPEIPDPCFVLPDDAAWAVEHGGVLGEFSVDDLLDFDGLEPDKETEHVEAHKTESFEEGDTATLLVDPPALSDINLPTHDPAEFEWMSNIIDDSYPPPCTGEALPVHRGPRPPVPVKAKRSKRSRAAGTTWPGFSGSLLSDTSNTTTTTTTTTASPSSSASSSPSYSSHFLYTDSIILYDSTTATPPRQPKKRGRKPKQHHKAPPHRAAGAGSERHCTHCGTMKTPQWRTGPLGPKTLCNACGVRFKSGRLVPEYRPAASPTFVSHVHSNSHRKVLEMRRKKEEQHVAAAAPPVASF